MPSPEKDAARLTVRGNHAFQLTVDRARLEAICKEAGRADIALPPAIDGAVVAVKIPRTVVARYGNCPRPPSATANVATPPPNSTEYSSCAVLSQSPSPVVDVPAGLDPMGRRLVRDVMRAQRDRGATVFLNSHLLSEVELTCDQVAFLKDGEVVASRDLQAVPEGEIRVVARGRKLTSEVVAGLAPWGPWARLEGEQLVFTTRSAETLPAALRYLVEAGAELYEFTPGRLSLEDLFVRIMGEDRGL